MSVMAIGGLAEKISRRNGVEIAAWKIRRAFNEGLLPPAQRFGPARIFTDRDITKIEKALRQLGYLPQREAVAV